MDDNGEGLDGKEFVFPSNLKPPSLGARFKKQNQTDPRIESNINTFDIETKQAETRNPETSLFDNGLSPRSQPASQQASPRQNSQQASPSKSPVDPTPIVINGSEFSRDDFTPIVDETDVQYNPIEEEIFVNSRQLTNRVEGNKRFDPPFPSYTTAVSTDASISSNQPQPKISSPSSDISIEPRPIRQNINYSGQMLQIDKRAFNEQNTSPPSPLPISNANKNQGKIITQSVPNVQTGQSKNPTTNKSSGQGPLPNAPSSKPAQGVQPENQNRNQNQNQNQYQKQKPIEPHEKPLTQEELIARAHDYFLKYQILQKSWPEYKFPTLDEQLVHTKPQVIIDSYTTSIERIQIDMDVSQYKIALIIMFLVIEVVSVKFLGFDAGGYTLSQIKAMNRYEKLLIEIGERKLLAGGDSWPPEVKILFIGLFNCALFILMKYLASILGPQLISYISPIVNGLFSGVLDTSSKASTLPDEIPKVPERQQDFSGMLGNVASMAANAFTNNTAPQATSGRATQKASRRPVYRE